MGDFYEAVEKRDEEEAARTMRAHLKFFIDNYSSRYNKTPLYDLVEASSVRI